MYRSIPEGLRESLRIFLRNRASILRSAPDIDRKTYCDHPREHELHDTEQKERVCVGHFYDDIGWPHKWDSINHRLASDSPEYRATLALSKLAKEIEKSDPESAQIVRAQVDALYFSSSLSVHLRVRTPKNEYGNCVEDVQIKRLGSQLPDAIATFVAHAHNTLIDVLAWLDRDLPRRERDVQDGLRLFGRERDLQAREKALEAKQKAHERAVKKAKNALAKQKADNQRLLDEANRRMDEAMTVARLSTYGK